MSGQHLHRMMGPAQALGMNLPQPEPLGAEDHWAAWTRLVRLFPTSSLPFSAYTTPGGSRFAGVDLLRGIRANQSSAEAAQLLAPLSPDTFNRVGVMAALNASRQEQAFKGLALAYLTVPVTLLAAWAQIVPGYVDRWLAANALGASIVALSLIGVGALQFFGWWRSRQIVAVLALIALDRAAAGQTSSPQVSAPVTGNASKPGRRRRSS
ncbi:hypothetical protein [Brevundimonas sp.]|uniref:hypothetical protein n=2 Tax=Brevundimonas sp. TaxID=1871086 RepID=UPI0026073CAC|nr:hypothetical protein [Brevundimonas sp.]